MRYKCFLIFLELLAFYLFYYYLKYPFLKTFFIVYTFISLYSLIFSTKTSSHLFSFIFYTHFLFIIIFFSVKILSVEEVKKTPILPIEQKVLYTQIDSMGVKLADRIPFVKSITLIAFSRFAEAKETTALMEDNTQYKAIFQNWIAHKKKEFHHKIFQAKQKESFIKEFLHLLEKENYEQAYKILEEQNKPQLKALEEMTLHLNEIKINQISLEKEIMALHLEFIKYSKKIAQSTIFLIPGTLQIIPRINNSLSTKNSITAFDLYFLQESLMDLEGFHQLRINYLNKKILLGALIQEPITQTLWGVNVIINNNQYPLVKILSDSMVSFQNNKTYIIPLEGIQKIINNSIYLNTYPYYYKWFIPSYVQQYASFYKEHIWLQHKNIIQLLLGYFILSIIVFVAYSTLRSYVQKKTHIFSSIILSIFITFITVIYVQLNDYLMNATLTTVYNYYLKFLGI